MFLSILVKGKPSSDLNQTWNAIVMKYPKNNPKVMLRSEIINVWNKKTLTFL